MHEKLWPDLDMPTCVMCNDDFMSAGPQGRGPPGLCPTCWLRADPDCARAQQAVCLQNDFDALQDILKTVHKLVVTGEAKFKRQSNGWACSIHLSNGVHRRAFLESDHGNLSAAGRAQVLCQFPVSSWTIRDSDIMVSAVGNLMSVPVYRKQFA